MVGEQLVFRRAADRARERSKMERENMKITLSRFAVTAMAFVVFTMVANAEGIPPQCSSVITSCGCTIGAPGNYQLGNDLYRSEGLTINNGCIDIEGDRKSV